MTHSATGWFKLPYTTAQERIQGEYLVLRGGYHSVDGGCPPWGTVREFESLFIGDPAGEVVVIYEDGTSQSVPLVFGFTLWFHDHWQMGKAPFLPGTDALALLEKTLQLSGGLEGEPECLLRIKIKPVRISSVEIHNNPGKTGMPVFTEGLCGFSDLLTTGQLVFLAAHTVTAGEPVPAHILDNLDRLNKWLITTEEEYLSAPAFAYPEGYTGVKITFTGNPYAHIASGVLYHNAEDELARFDSNGFVHESAWGAPSWFYNGFGTYKLDNGSYYNDMYARNRTSALLAFRPEAAARMFAAASFAHTCLMYPVEKGLSIRGLPIPGHWTMVINDYRFYHEQLIHNGWPSRHITDGFGEESSRLGSMETDGHGLMMLFIYALWRENGKPVEWVTENWKYINEAVTYIDWCLQHPEVSFSQNGMLYGESEGGMQEHTLYLNMPCYVGVRMYADMAKAAGKQEEKAWRALALRMEQAIQTQCLHNGKWLTGKFGFYHDPTLTTLADYLGFDLGNDHPEWFARTLASYEDDLAQYIGKAFVGPRGVGYDHNMITQNALLLDKVEDYSKFAVNLAKICYSPRQPSPYIVPECVTYSKEKQAFRRQGDLGNLVQQAETLKTLQIITGLSLPNNNLKIMPRLPVGWGIEVEKAKVPGCDAVVSYKTKPNIHAQTCIITVHQAAGYRKLRFRCGPFAPGDKMQATVNGQQVQAAEEIREGWRWIWVPVLLNNNTDQLFTITCGINE